jgi:hypothetical protein
LAEVLIELLEIATGDAEIVGWRFPALEIHEWTAHEVLHEMLPERLELNP